MKNFILTATFCVGVVSPLFSQHKDYPIQPVPFTAVKVNDDFWAPRIKRNHEVTIPIALKQCYFCIPEAYKLLYKDAAGVWKEVKTEKVLEIEKDQYNEARFEPVEATALRMEIQSREGFAGGIQEWVVD